VVNPVACKVQLSLPHTSALPTNVVLEFQKPKYYPDFLPPRLVIMSEPKLPAHVRLSLIRQAGLYAWESLRGMGMVYALSEWVEENFERIAQNPGRLKELDGAISGETGSSFCVSRRVEVKTDMKTAPIDWTPRAPIAPRKVPEYRKSLPAWKHQEEIASVTQSNTVVLVTGETGSGKSTQVPQFILDDLISRGLSHAVNIICTQPRRISAIGLADRVAEELGEKVGVTVGYSIRGETKSSAATKLRFVTTGTLLRRFLNDTELNGVSHVIVDEVHERTVDGDFLLLLLRELLKKRSDLTVVLMSATVAAEEYASYFSSWRVGRVHIEGRTYPVRDIYLEALLKDTGYRSPLRKHKGRDNDDDDEEYESEIGESLRVLNEGLLDYDLISKTVGSVCQKSGDQGGILIFMPGWTLLFA
jgi:ATP-dependent RNA helicase DHX57